MQDINISRLKFTFLSYKWIKRKTYIIIHCSKLYKSLACSLLCICFVAIMKSTVLLIVLSCAVATTLASPDQLVSEAIGEVLNSGLRHRRDVESTPNVREKGWCFCGKTNWLKTFDQKTQDISNTCNKENVPSVQENQNGNSENSSTSGLSKDLCKFNCLFKKLNLLNSEDNLDKSAIKTYFMDNVFVDDWMRNIAGNLVDKCLNNGSSADLIAFEDALFFTAKDTTCRKEPQKFFICLLMEMELNCPADQKSTESQCSGFNEVMDNLKKRENKN